MFFFSYLLFFFLILYILNTFMCFVVPILEIMGLGRRECHIRITTDINTTPHYNRIVFLLYFFRINLSPFFRFSLLKIFIGLLLPLFDHNITILMDYEVE
uniref:Uncharacterized protein n=1 Tax=Cacopsylla melanoneura TaxID=428564 RepID=A0A8D8Z6U6_9HEMI